MDKKVIKCLEQYPLSIKNRILDKMNDVLENPFRHFKKLKQRSEYSMHVGVYRVIADIDTSSRKIIVTKVGRRKHVYD